MAQSHIKAWHLEALTLRLNLRLVVLGIEIDISTKYRSAFPEQENRQNVVTNKDNSRKTEFLFKTSVYSIAT